MQELYTDNNPNTTIHNTGFKNAKIAQKTLNIIKHRSLIYKRALVNTLYNRAKYHPNITPDMKEAMQIFKTFLNNNKNIKIKYEYLDLNLINKYEKLANIYDISHVARGLEKPVKSDYGFLVIYRKIKGKYYKLPFIPVFKKKPEHGDYDKLRESFINARLGQMKQRKIALYNKTGEFKNLPTVQHVVLIMNGYSPDPNGLKQRLKLLNNL